jgi:hypothetical protein
MKKSKTKTLTLSSAQAQAREYDARITSKRDEYRVTLAEEARNEARAYYTNDLDDALATARAKRDEATRNVLKSADDDSARAARVRTRAVMLDVDSYARLTTAAALLHSDEKVNAARDARAKCFKTITALVMQTLTRSAK